ncbi:MAG TPA: hypothetical protein VNF68_15215 [Candidatus Baltobacteraceae bacterium]|nr:hypothetical protein [Candidatus Baltobacteraceae bacterium]
MKAFIAALLFAATFPLVAHADELGSDGRLLNGMAPLYVPFPGTSSRSVRADLTLPDRSANKQWYSNWAMIVGTANGASHQVFVQVGLIRRPGQYAGIRAFLAWQSAADTSIHYSELAPLADATHLVELRETASGFAAYIDSRPVGPIIAMPFATAYAQIGPEVYAEGDALAGTVRNVVVASGSTIDRISGSNFCYYINHGVALAFSDGSYVATGTFSRNKPSRFAGDCTGISSPRS